MVLYIGIYIESDWLYHAEWVALSNGQSGSELAEYSFFATSFPIYIPYIGGPFWRWFALASLQTH